jgi:hypothetical protein
MFCCNFLSMSAISRSLCRSTWSCASKSDRRFSLRWDSNSLICFWPASFSSSVGAAVAVRRASVKMIAFFRGKFLDQRQAFGKRNVGSDLPS